MKQFVTIIIILIVIGFGIYFIVARGGTEGPAATSTPTTTDEEMDDENAGNDQDTSAATTSDDEMQGAETVTYTGSGFQPSSLTVETGTTVEFVNESQANMWVAVDQHPTHTQFDGTTRSQHCPDPQNEVLDQCETGDSYSFTFEESGAYSYHDHRNPGATGEIIVE